MFTEGYGSGQRSSQQSPGHDDNMSAYPIFLIRLEFNCAIPEKHFYN